MDRIENTDAQYVSLPETFTRRQLNALYREIPLKDTVSRTLRKYFSAMANLYGVITLSKAYEIISEQCPSLVSETEFLAFAEIARHECEDYLILGDDEIFTDGKTESLFEREIIDIELLDDDMDLYLQTKQSQQGKPYYVPHKKQLLLYSEAFYCEATPEVTALQSFLADRFSLKESQISAIIFEILYSSRYLNNDISDVFTYLDDIGLEFKSESDSMAFLKQLQKINNTTRMQCNRGYTPDELSKLYSAKDRAPKSLTLGPNIRKAIADGTMDANDLRREVLTMELPSEELRFNILKEIADAEAAANKQSKPQKVGRNDPCPCGSGKKYKKCCGR